MMERAVFFDIEWTAWEGSAARNWSAPGEYREIVQIGAVRVNVADAFAEIESFHVLVRPLINSTLSDYFVSLTGLTQRRVDAEGVTFAEALEGLASFLGSEDAYSNGRDKDILAENCRLYRLPFPFARNRFVNLRPVFSEATGLPPQALVSGKLPTILGFGPDNEVHDALADARAVASAARVLSAQKRICAGPRRPISINTP